MENMSSVLSGRVRMMRGISLRGRIGGTAVSGNACSNPNCPE